LFEFFPKEYFEEKYKAVLKACQEYKNYDFGWSNLDFIKAFFDSMRGFEQPVMYPHSEKGKGEGFQWFSQNEKTNRYSLPVIGQTLKSN
ncbi:MAG: hypothetical protein IJ597_02250, partial [Synergistaceae bacterium]|nr:hypothetical protein [Synergistaceae bacterium]